MPSWTVAATLDDLWEGDLLAVTVDDVDVLLCHLPGEVVAYEDRCPHLANLLSNGRLQDSELTCAAHEWVFDLRTGAGVNPATARLRRIPVRLEGDTVLVSCDGWPE